MSTRRFLWLLVALLAIVDLLAVFSSSIALTMLHLTILVTFAFVHGALRYGVGGVLAFIAICLVVSNAMENIGVATGFPFGPYHYTEALGLKLGYVPLLIGPAYLGVGYLAWVIGTVLVGDVKRGDDSLTTFATPLIGAFVMVLWDLSLDPAVSTLGGWWVWEKGGGFFGVPLSNYLGWYLTVFAFMQIFALYLNAWGPERSAPQPKSHFMQATAMYAVIALQFVVNYAVKGSSTIIDARGIEWRSGDLLEASAITAIFTMLFVAVLAVVKIASMPAKASSSPD
jgi:putative membrane protein